MMSQNDPRVERTRRAILTAAAQVLAHDRSASMAAIAREAGIGRATLHRHFATREALLLALAVLAIDYLSEAIAASNPGEGPVAEALLRVTRAILPLADELRFLSGGPDLWELGELQDRWYSMTTVIEDIVRRGQAEGVLRIDLSVAWQADHILGTIWNAADMIRDGRLAPHDADRVIVETVTHGISQPHSQVTSPADMAIDADASTGKERNR